MHVDEYIVKETSSSLFLFLIIWHFFEAVGFEIDEDGLLASDGLALLVVEFVADFHDHGGFCFWGVVVCFEISLFVVEEGYFE